MKYDQSRTGPFVFVYRGIIAGFLFASTYTAAASAASETVLHAFGAVGDGSRSFADLSMGPDGALYGRTQGGGGDGKAAGTVFKLIPKVAGKTAWTETILHILSGEPDDNNPIGGVIMDSAGALYGAYDAGGSSACGAVFKLTPPASGNAMWTETILHSFTCDSQDPGRDYPNGDLLMDAAGALYGVTLGTVYKLTSPPAGTTDWSFTVLHDFVTSGNPQDGFSLEAGVIIDSKGSIYGTSYEGGNGTIGNSGGDGTVFKLTPPTAGKTAWTETILYKFQGGWADGEGPYGSVVMDAAGALYGTTLAGGSTYVYNHSLGDGVAYKLTPPAAGKAGWTETIIHNFVGDPDGTRPQGSLSIDGQGALYGTARGGGASKAGVVFKLVPPAAGKTAWSESILHSFKSVPDGASPEVGLLLDTSGILYGTTAYGGVHGKGIVFKVTP